MATFSTYKAGGTSGTPTGTRHWEINVATWKAANAALTTNDKMTLFDVPANTVVTFHQIEIVSQGTLATRLDVGDSAADTTFVNNAATLTTGTDLTLATTSKFYGAADSIFVKLGNAATTGIIRVVYSLTNTNRNAIAVVPTPAIS